MKNRLKYINSRTITLLLIIFQSIGIRFFDGQGTVISIIIIVIWHKNFKYLLIKDVRFLIIAFLLILISKIINDSFIFSSLLYQLSLIISIYLFLVSYRRRIGNLINDFFLVLQIFVLHAVMGYLLYLIMPNQFNKTVVLNESFYYLFYISNSTFGGFHRNTGILWEPGVFQFVANLFLFYCIKFNKSTIIILLAFLAVVSSLSTTGLVILIFNTTYFFYCKWKEKKLKIINIMLVFLLMIVFIPSIIMNFKDKTNLDNTSGVVRLRDYYLGIDLIKEKPFLGHGLFDSQYILSKAFSYKIESKLFSKEYLNITGNMGGGFTNGFFGLIVCYGIPVSFLLYFFCFKNKFVDNDFIERIIFYLIILISSFFLPITFTSFFLMFPFSHWILNQKKSTKRKPRNFTLATYHKRKQLI